MSMDPVIEKLLKARFKILIEWPLFAPFIISLELKEVDWCPTAATDGRYFYYSREFVEKLTPEQVEFLTGHECLHVIFEHIFRRGHRNKELWNIACLAWNTSVLMADGTNQPIQKIVPGDYIASPFGPSKVLGNMFSGIKPTMEYVVGNRHIRSTEDHKYASKEGFFDANKIINTQSYGYIFNPSRSKTICSPTSQRNVVDGFDGGNRSRVWSNCRISETERTYCESLFKKAIEYSIAFEIDNTRICLFGRDDRWGWHNNGSKERQVHPALNNSNEYIQYTERMVDKPRLSLLCEDESLRQEILSYGGVGLGIGHHPGIFDSISRYQASKRFMLVEDNKTTEELAISWANDGRNIKSGNSNTGIERASFSVREGPRERTPVFDLITEFGVFFANGIMTHNCDAIVNYTLIHTKNSNGKTIGAIIENVPPVEKIIYDPAYTDEFSAEEVYALLEKDITKIKVKIPLDMHLDPEGGSGDGDEEKSDGKNGPPRYSPEEIEQIRDTIRTTLIEAAQQQNVDPGTLPAGIRRMLNKLLEPKIDWRQMIDNVIRSAIKYDYTYARLSRRYWSTGFVLPGQEVLDKVVVHAFLDGSGSTSQEMVTDFLSECKGIMQTFPDFELTIGTFDTDVYEVITYTPDNADEIDDYPFTGGGGTAPSCCWNYLKKHDIVPHKCLIFTDGHVGTDWGEEGYCETLFIVHSNPSAKAPFGLTCHYEPRIRL